jgi:periplasmic copper chaperone A
MDSTRIMTRRSITTLLAATALAALPATARAHISVASAPAAANSTQMVVFGVGHGCAGADTYRVRVQLPAGVSSVRPMNSDFGRTSVEKDAAGTITAVVWQRADADMLDSDINYYTLTLRLKTPNSPFTTLFFPTQTCRAADGTLSTADWIALPTDPPVDGAAPEPAPALPVLPAHQPGWNKMSVAQAVSDPSAFFSDAQIVWKGTAAYSPNPTTTELIKATTGVSALGALAAGDEIWVKY